MLLIRLDGVRGRGSEGEEEPMFRKAERGRLEPRTLVLTWRDCYKQKRPKLCDKESRRTPRIEPFSDLACLPLLTVVSTNTSRALAELCARSLPLNTASGGLSVKKTCRGAEEVGLKRRGGGGENTSDSPLDETASSSRSLMRRGGRGGASSGAE